MLLSRNEKNNVYLCKPQFYYIEVGFKGVKIIYVCLCDVRKNCVDPHQTATLGSGLILFAGAGLFDFLE